MAQAELPASYQSGEGEKEDRKTAAGFYYQLAVFHVKAGNREAAEEASPNAGTAWKGIRLALLDDPVLAEVIF